MIDYTLYSFATVISVDYKRTLLRSYVDICFDCNGYLRPNADVENGAGTRHLFVRFVRTQIQSRQRTVIVSLSLTSGRSAVGQTFSALSDTRHFLSLRYYAVPGVSVSALPRYCCDNLTVEREITDEQS